MPLRHALEDLHVVHVHRKIANLIESVPHRKLELRRRLMRYRIHVHHVFRGALQRDAIGDALRGTPEGRLLGRHGASKSRNTRDQQPTIHLYA